MNTQHTPGPWHVSFNTIRQGPVVIADCAPVKEAQANARLIVAAPDLLSAMELIAEGAEKALKAGITGSDNAMLLLAGVDAARAAIAKATQP